MSSAKHNPALRLRLLRELAQRLCWSGFAYSLFAALYSLNLARGVRGAALALAAFMAALGALRTHLAFRIIKDHDVELNGQRLIDVVRAMSLAFGVFVAYSLWHVQGQVIPECLLVLGVAGVSSLAASLFAPLPGLNTLNVCAQVVPVYVWSVYALPRYGWLLEAFILIHAVALAQIIRMNGAHLRETFIAELALKAQGEELRQARDAADAAASAKMHFLANMSHEIRTPLNGILGLAEVLNQLALTEQQRAVLEDIGRSGNHLLSILNDILDMAKVSSGKLLPEQAPFDLPRMIRDITSPAAALAEAKHLRFHLRTPRELPGQVRGDALRIRQVLSNLLGNAVKFTPSGEVGLTVHLVRPGWIRFDVMDTGIGLAPEQKEGLFQEFHQVDSSAARRFGGSGLGLAISRRLVELMGGRLWVESTVGEGSTFSFELPLEAAEAAPASDDIRPAADEPVMASGLPRGLRVLVAEDNSVNQKVIVMMLSQVGAKVDLAGNGREAIQRHQASPYDLILMDCQMPDLDGYEATAQIRLLPDTHGSVPIIGVTANAFAEDRDRCIRAGMNGYVAKPLSRAALMEAIQQCVPGERSTDFSPAEQKLP